MKISSFILTVAAQVSLATLTTLAHPGSGIVVDQQGNVYFTHTGHGAGKIDAQGKLTSIHHDTGGHWIALDAEGSFSSAAGNRLFERITPEGKVTILLTVAPDDGLSSRADSLSGSKGGDEREISGVKLCWCPPGRFRMGSPPHEPDRRPEEAQVEVTLSKGFWMGKYEVTQGQWKRVVGEFPGKLTAIAGEGDDFPVYWVNFGEAEGYCRKLTELAHKSGDLPAEWEFRIPTEAQWEYACRAGTTTATSFGGTLNRKQANFAGKPYAIPDGPDAGPSLQRATKAGRYPANAWGLHDMHGNEFEWCRDWYHAKLPVGVDPDRYSMRGTPNGDGTYSRVRRGGSWGDDGLACRSARRLRYEPDRGADHIGFRVVAVRQ